MPLDLEAFQKTRVYQARATVAEVLEDLQALDPRSKRAPEEPDPASVQARKGKRLGQGLLLTAGVSFVILRLLPSSQEGLAALFGFLCFLTLLSGFIVLLVSFINRQTASMGMSLDRENLFAAPHKEPRRQLLATLLKRFQVDLDANAPVDVRMDLTSPTEPGKRVHQGKHGAWDREDFSDPWLSLQGRFADGTQLHLSVEEQVRRLERKKVMPRKVKHQRKQSGVSLMTVALRVNPERYPGLADMNARAQGLVRLPPGATLKRLRVAGDRVELRVLLDEDGVPRSPRASGEDDKKTDASRTVTMMLLSLYQVLNHSSSSQGQPGKVRSTP
ncbi:hypothetical protein [Corallococcus aberystwythensis]|uniref:Uncharacterized protein n=1 Tax=Corallococcus aberystwythensis TaxID=2316722 RepID=A0A3A8QTM6_9BACT|nr:hypothetical protein [Corallococcus aberystwythensis]RKH72063.1 hypothetical protein D7W81_06450 [Corallococcus aberystwythensis]